MIPFGLNKKKPKPTTVSVAEEEGFSPEEVDSWGTDGVSPEELDGVAPAKPAPKDSGHWNDYNYFTNQLGERERRKMDWQDRTTGAVLGMLEAPLFGANDEVVGTTSALMEQGQEFFGLMPKGYRARTVSEGIKRAQDLKNAYADARETGEIGFWDPDNVASNTAGTIASFMPYDELYKGAKGAANIAQQLITGTKATSKLHNLYNAIYGLAGSGAIGSELYEIFTPDGDVKERAKKVIEAGGGPAIMGAVFGLGGGALGKGLVSGGQFVGKRLAPAAKQAARRLAELLNDSGVSLEEIALKHGDNLTVKPDVTLAEAGPDHFRAWQTEGGVAARQQGSQEMAAQTLLERQKSSTRRVAQDIADDYGADGNFKTTFDGLKKSAQEKSAPLYQEAYAAPPLQSPELMRLINSSTGRKMMQAALDVMEAAPGAKKPLVATDAAGNIIGWPTEAIQYMKMGLDDMITNEFTKQGRPQIANAYKDYKKLLLSEVDKLNPKYAEARAAYAGEMEAREAIEAGYKNAYAHPSELNAKMSEFTTPSEREFFNRGMAQRRLNDVRTTPHGANVGGKMLNTDAKVDSAQWALGEKYNPHARKMELEQRMTDSFNEVYGNSKTAERLAAQEDSKAQSAEEMFNAVITPSIEPTMWIKAVGTNRLAQLLRRLDKDKNKEIARMLFSRNREEQAAAIKAVQDQMSYAEQKAVNSRMITAAGGMASGTGAAGQGAVANISDERGF